MLSGYATPSRRKVCPSSRHGPVSSVSTPGKVSDSGSVTDVQTEYPAK